MLPYMISNVKKERVSISTFGGLNRTVTQKTGELSGSKNTSGRGFPALCSIRSRSEPIDTNVRINGIGSRNGLFYTGTTDEKPLETNMYFAGTGYSLTVDASAEDANQKRSFGVLGDSVLVIPDNKVFNTTDSSVYNIEYSKSMDYEMAHEIAKTECSVSTLNDPDDYIGEITPAGIVSVSHKQNGYLSYFMTFEEIKAGDVVHISMNVYPREYDEIDIHYTDYRKKMKEGVEAKVVGVNVTSYKTANGTVRKITSIDFGENVIDMGGYSTVVISSITLSRRMPPLEYICTLNNRVWGVYGNTVRCSKLGDSAAWYDFSADAYGTLPSSCFCTEVDSCGSFTGIVAYGGGIVAFKENCLHKIYGSDPDSYTVSTLDCRGVRSGCADTVALIGGTVYYVGLDGVYAYRGTVPELVSKKPDLSHIDAVCAGTDGKNYYLIADEEGSRVMYVYYPVSKSWHREDILCDTHLMVTEGDRLYSVSDSCISCISGAEGDEAVEWSFSLRLNKDMYNICSYDRLFINYSLAHNGEFFVKTVCDGDLRKTHISPEYNHRDNAYSVIPLPYTGCMDFELYFEGKGDFTLKNITIEYTVTPEEKGIYI